MKNPPPHRRRVYLLVAIVAVPTESCTTHVPLRTKGCSQWSTSPAPHPALHPLHVRAPQPLGSGEQHVITVYKHDRIAVRRWKAHAKVSLVGNDPVLVRRPSDSASPWNASVRGRGEGGWESAPRCGGACGSPLCALSQTGSARQPESAAGRPPCPSSPPSCCRRAPPPPSWGRASARRAGRAGPWSGPWRGRSARAWPWRGRSARVWQETELRNSKTHFRVQRGTRHMVPNKV